MQWAAGIHVAGVPDNPYPAQIENLSLGGPEICPSVYSNVIPTLLAKGVLIVASAGNEGGPVDAPANCPGVAAIAGLREAGDKVGYSSLGPEVALAAPAGNCGQNSTGTGLCLYELETTVNLGTTTPGANGYTDEGNRNLGTSFSAPLVSGTAALMLAVNGNLVAPQLIARLKEGVPHFSNNTCGGTTTTFPTCAADVVGAQPPQCGTPGAFGDTTWDVECLCTTAVCGAGILNVPGALAAALRPIAGVTVPASVSSGQMVTLDANPSTAACGHSIASYAWVVTGGAATLTSNSGVTTSLTAPVAGNPVSVQLTVKDELGRTDVVTIAVTSNSAAALSVSTSQAPPSVAGTHACLAPRNVTSPMSTATLTASAKSVPVGTGVTLNWSSTGAKQCHVSNGAIPPRGWTLATSGSMSVSEATVGVYNYTLSCYGSTVSNAETAPVSVEPAVTLTSSAASAQPGQAFTLTWSSKQATTCSPSGGGSGDGWSTASGTSGGVTVTEAAAGSYTYTLTCTDGAVSGTAQVKMSISAPAPGGGGGGAVDLLLIAVLPSIGFLRRR
jgi:hypothetical protein